MNSSNPDYRLGPVPDDGCLPQILVPVASGMSRRHMIREVLGLPVAFMTFGGMHILSAATPALKAHSGGVIGLAVSPDGKTLASGSGNQELKLWPLGGPASGPRRIETGPSQIYTLAFSTAGKLLLCGFAEGEIELRGMPTGALVKRWAAHPKADVMSVAFAGNDEVLISCGKDGTVRLWSMPDCALRSSLPLGAGEVRSLAVSPDGQMVAVACEREIRLWSLSVAPFAVRRIARRQAHADMIADIAFVSGKRIASASYDKTVGAYDVPTLEPVATYAGHSAALQAVRWIPPHGRLASASDDKTVRLWSLDDDQDLHELHGHEDVVASLACTPDGTRLFSGAGDGVIICWDLAKRAADGFLFDPAANPTSSTGITYTTTDRITGHVLTFTLPCGSPIPAGATCICNCVPGTYAPPPPPRISSEPRYPSTIRIPTGTTIRQPCTAQPVPPGYICTCNCIPGR
jgi:WD40 repeat protein